MTHSSEQEEKRQKRFAYLTQTPVPRLMMELSVPTIISMLVTALYNMADTFFVGRISTEATASVGLVFSVMAIMQALGFFCGHGSGNFISRRLGAGAVREGEEMAATGFALAFLLGLAVAVAGTVFCVPLSRLLGATETTAADTQSYMRVILLGAPFMMSQLVLNNQLRFQGSAVYAMVGLVSGAILNVAIDPLLIFTLGLGVRGAAVATVLSQLVSFCILLAGTRRGGNIRIRAGNIRFTPYYLLQIVNGGAPSLFRQGLASVSTLLLNNLAGRYGGDVAIAGMSVVTRVMMFALSALIGFGQGFQPLCAFNYGAQKTGRVKEAFWFCVKYGTAFLLVMAALGLSFAPHIIRFFRDDDAVVAVGKVALRFQAAVFPLNAFVVMSNMFMQSIGKGVKASILSAARNGLFFIPLVIVLSAALGLTGVEMTQACADLCAVALSAPLTLSELRKL